MGELMKIKVENLGPLKIGEFVLKPLMIFIGPNNTGKTYLAYLISALCVDSPVRNEIMNIIELPPFRKQKLYYIPDNNIKELLSDGFTNIKVDLEKLIDKHMEFILTIVRKISTTQIDLRKFSENFWAFLGSDNKKLFEDLKIDIKLPDINSADKIRRLVYYRGLSQFSAMIMITETITVSNSVNVYKKESNKENISVFRKRI